MQWDCGKATGGKAHGRTRSKGKGEWSHAYVKGYGKGQWYGKSSGKDHSYGKGYGKEPYGVFAGK